MGWPCLGCHGGVLQVAKPSLNSSTERGGCQVMNGLFTRILSRDTASLSLSLSLPLSLCPPLSLSMNLYWSSGPLVYNHGNWQIMTRATSSLHQREPLITYATAAGFALTLIMRWHTGEISAHLGRRRLRWAVRTHRLSELTPVIMIRTICTRLDHIHDSFTCWTHTHTHTHTHSSLSHQPASQLSLSCTYTHGPIHRWCTLLITIDDVMNYM